MADAPEPAGFLRDYLYIDRVRLALILAQLLPEGIPESARRSSEEDRTSTKDYGADVKLARFGGKETERIAQSLEQDWPGSNGKRLRLLGSDRLGTAPYRNQMKLMRTSGAELKHRCGGGCSLEWLHMGS